MEGVSVRIIPLVPNLELPRRSSARTRATVPPGYGVQEQCLPFTAASGLDFRIVSPIRFGLCPIGDVPADCRAFRAPIAETGARADWVFYVADDSRCRFAANAFAIDIPHPGAVEPGISFFDRADQQDLFKLHLPYIWRTPADVDTLFLPPLNRPAQGLAVQCGLVETEWYANPVNLILRKSTVPVHVSSGDDIAQAVLVSRLHRSAQIEVVASHARVTRETLRDLTQWHRHHAENRSAYKLLARSRHGRLDDSRNRSMKGEEHGEETLGQNQGE